MKNKDMFRNVIIFMLAAVICISIPGCTAVRDVGGVEVTDALGVSVTLPEQPKTVAVLFSSLADIWVSAGGETTITVGESVERGFAADTAVLVDTGAGKSIDTEALIAAKPDLVIASADIAAQADAAALCRKAGIPAASFRVESFGEYLQVLKLFTALTGDAAAYEQAGTAVQKRVETLLAEHAGAFQNTDILFIRAGSGARSTKAKTADDHFACAMLKELGTCNIAESAPVLLDGLSFEHILMEDPDYIFISTMGDEQAAKDYMHSVMMQPQWQGLTAVQNDNVVFLPKALFQFKPNAKWAEAYAWLIEALNE